MSVLHVRTSFGFEIEEIPDEDIVAGLIPDIPDPVEEIGGTPGTIRRRAFLRQRGSGPDDEPGVSEGVKLLAQCHVLQLVILDSLVLRADVGHADVGQNVADWKTMFEDDDVVLWRKNLQRRFFQKRT